MGSVSPPNVFVVPFFFQVVIPILAPLNFLRGGKTKRGGGGGEGGRRKNNLP